VINDKGEVVDKFLSILLMEKEGQRRAYLADKGLLSQMELASIKPGMDFEAKKGEKRKITKGRTMNSWEIYV
jgi:hypothetical protein